MVYNTILLEFDGPSAILTINRPDQLNALNQECIEEISQAFHEIEKSDCAGAIVIGSGEKAFVAGADIKEFTGIEEEQAFELSNRGQEVFDYIAHFKKPVIAAVNGFALGGGCELALACHMRICSDNAQFGLPEVTLGLIPGYGGTQRLPSIIGKGRAMEMITTAQRIDATKANNWGLVNDVVSQSELLDKAKSIISKISNNAPLAVESAIEAVNHFKKHNGYALESELFSGTVKTKDFEEGVKAFMEKRKAEFKGS